MVKKVRKRNKAAQKAKKKQPEVQPDEEESFGSDVSMSFDEEESKPKKKNKQNNVSEFFSNFDTEMGNFEVEMKESEDDSDKEEDKEIETAGLNLEQIKKDDPEFYSYLIKNDPSIVKFSGNQLNSVNDNEIDQEELDDMMAEEEQRKPRVSVQLLDELENNISVQKNTSSMKQYLLIFQSCCYITDKQSNYCVYDISNSSVFNRVIQFSLQDFVYILNEHFDLTKNEFGKPSSLPNTRKSFMRLEKAIKSFLLSTLHFAQELTDSKMRSFVIQACERLTPYFACFDSISKKLLKVLLEFWVSADDTTRICAFSALRQLSLDCPFPFIDSVLKGSYLTFLRSSKYVSKTSLPTIIFLTNCIVELYSLDVKSSYQFAFIYLRQLSVFLRQAMIKPSQSKLGTIRNWQFVNGLRVWANVLTALKDDQSMSQLVHPFVQLVCGTLDISMVPRFSGFVVNLLELLIAVVESCHSFFSISKYLIQILNWSEMKNKPKLIDRNNLTQKPKEENKKKKKNAKKKKEQKPVKNYDHGLQEFDFSVVLKLKEEDLKRKEYQDAMVNKIYELFIASLSQHAYNIAFPEMIVPICVFLKKYQKECKSVFVQKMLTQLKKRLNQNSEYILEKRKNVSFVLSQQKQIESFLEKEKLENKAPITKARVLLEKEKDLTKQITATQIEEEMFDEEIKGEKKRKKSRKDESKDGEEDEEEDIGFLPEKKPKKEEKKKKAQDEELGSFSDLEEKEEEDIDAQVKKIISKLGMDEENEESEEMLSESDSYEVYPQKKSNFTKKRRPQCILLMKPTFSFRSQKSKEMRRAQQFVVSFVPEELFK